jgi:hypothetical protein
LGFEKGRRGIAGMRNLDLPGVEVGKVASAVRERSRGYWEMS